MGKWLDMDVHTGKPSKLKRTARLKLKVAKLTPHDRSVASDAYGQMKNIVTPTATAFKDRAGIDLPTVYAIALRWTALEPGSVFEAIWGFDKAKNWTDFRNAARNFVVPAQNLMYADVDGNIGYQMPGNIPIRTKGDGRLPVPGWTGEYEWTGYIPFDEHTYVSWATLRVI